MTDRVGQRVFVPGEKPPRPGSAKPDSRASFDLPPDLRLRATRQLRITALAYSGAYLFAYFVPRLTTEATKDLFQRPIDWIATVSILMGLAVATVASNAGIGWRARLYMGLLFQILGSLGIALAMYWTIENSGWLLSPSWAAIWLIMYAVSVPAPPRLAFAASLLSGAMAPAVIWVSIQHSPYANVLTLGEFLLICGVQYGVCVALATVGSYVVYRLGREVTRARELGSYQLGERLGAGGMGEVWTASHRMLARPAAIKFIRPAAVAGANPDEDILLLKRFEREAQATAALTSPHTVQIFDYGLTDDGTFYYVMELLEGLDLENLVARFGPTPPARVVFLLAQACEALEEAHAKGLIHRDVKPANVYICRSGMRHDFVKMLDFGLVADRRPASTNTQLTMSGHATGTPTYMAPEIARGELVDGRADLYALACVAYWMLTAKPVFTGGSVFEIVSQHLQASPEPPSRYAPNPVPAELEELILVCLEKDPDSRPADAGIVRQRLGKVPLADHWAEEEANAWWAAHLPTRADTLSST